MEFGHVRNAAMPKSAARARLRGGPVMAAVDPVSICASFHAAKITAARQVGLVEPGAFKPCAQRESRCE